MTVDPVKTTGSFLRKVRRRYILLRLAKLTTLAITVDLIKDMITLSLFNIWGIKITVPFLFEIILVVLIVREWPSWSIEGLGELIDRRFSLKDRFYSFVRYEKDPGIPMEIKVAQARETIGAADFAGILKSTRFRIPVLLPFVLPMFAGLLYLSWNSEYLPGGITSRIVNYSGLRLSDPGRNSADTDNLSSTVRNVTPENRFEPEEDDPRTDGRSATTSGKDVPGSSDQGSAQAASEQGAGIESTQAAVASEGDTTEAGGPGGPGGVDGAHGKNGKPLDGSMTPPQSLVSVLQTDSISEPIPPALAKNSSYVFQELPEATRFLNLVPGQGGQALAPLDKNILSKFMKEINRYPESYRERLYIYYRELEQQETKP